MTRGGACGLLLLVLGLFAAMACSSSEEFGRREEVAVDGGTLSVIGPTEPCGDGELTVLLLHGASFEASTWSETGAMERLCAAGFGVVAVDLPGFGETATFDHDPVRLMDELVDFVDGEVMVVFPSMSGGYVLPWINQTQHAPLGVVGVAPVGLGDWTPPSDTPPEISLIWGTDDDIIPVEVARDFAARYPVDLVEIPGGGHAPYKTHPDEFGDAPFEFLADLSVG